MIPRLAAVGKGRKKRRQTAAADCRTTRGPPSV